MVTILLSIAIPRAGPSPKVPGNGRFRTRQTKPEKRSSQLWKTKKWEHFQIWIRTHFFSFFFHKIYSAKARVMLAHDQNQWAPKNTQNIEFSNLGKCHFLAMLPGFFSRHELLQKWSESMYLLDKKLKTPSDEIRSRSVTKKSRCPKSWILEK